MHRREFHLPAGGGIYNELVEADVFRDLERRAITDVDQTWTESVKSLWGILDGKCKIMKGRSIIVGSSKLLPHLLPDLFPPIDWSYTLDFLRNLSQAERYRVAIEGPEFDAFLTTMSFYGFVAGSVPGIEKYKDDRPMNGSIPKVIDNAIIAWWGTEESDLNGQGAKGRIESQ